LRALANLEEDWDTRIPDADLYTSIQGGTRPRTFFRKTCTKHMVDSLYAAKHLEGDKHAIIKLDVGGHATRVVYDGPGPASELVPSGQFADYLFAVLLEGSKVADPHSGVDKTRSQYKAFKRRWQKYVDIIFQGKVWKGTQRSKRVPNCDTFQPDHGRLEG